MTPEEIYADLAGTSEIAQRLGVDVRRVRRWVDRRAEVGCPEPKRRLTACDLYSMTEWRGWWALWRVTRAPSPPTSPS